MNGSILSATFLRKLQADALERSESLSLELEDPELSPLLEALRQSLEEALAGAQYRCSHCGRLFVPATVVIDGGAV